MRWGTNFSTPLHYGMTAYEYLEMVVEHTIAKPRRPVLNTDMHYLNLSRRHL